MSPKKTAKSRRPVAAKKAPKKTRKAGAKKVGKKVEKKASPKAPSSRAPTKRQGAERVKVGGLRTLGDVEPAGRGRPPATKPTAHTRKARTILEQEFERALALKEKLAAEAAIGGKEKGREATRQQEKLRAIVNSLEGMNRFALQMGLIAPAEARELYAHAMKRGLYDGWRR